MLVYEYTERNTDSSQTNLVRAQMICIRPVYPSHAASVDYILRAGVGTGPIRESVGSLSRDGANVPITLNM